MALSGIICTVFTDSLQPLPQVTESPVISDGATQATTLATDFASQYMNMDFITEILVTYAKAFALGFAFSTLLILATYGVFKALGFIHIY
mgnify:CR=1 FL=1